MADASELTRPPKKKANEKNHLSHKQAKTNITTPKQHSCRPTSRKCNEDAHTSPSPAWGGELITMCVKERTCVWGGITCINLELKETLSHTCANTTSRGSRHMSPETARKKRLPYQGIIVHVKTRPAQYKRNAMYKGTILAIHIVGFDVQKLEQYVPEKH